VAPVGEGRVEDQSLLIAIGLPVALFIIMVGIGLTLTVRDFQREAEHPKGMVVGAFGQILIMPLLGFLVVMLFGLSGALAVGVVIVAACPGGATSNLICFLGRANVALSIALTVIASLITVVTLPLFTEFAIDWQGLAAAGVELPVVETILRLIVIVIIPVIIGMAIRNRNADLANRAERLVSLFGAIVLIALIVGITIDLWADVPTYLRQAGPAVVLLNVVGIIVGMVSGRLTGLSESDSLTLGMELGVKNATVGILIATLISADFTYAVPSAVYGLLMYASAAALVAYGRRRWQVTAGEAAATG
jgi:bile acid:Na+ symporter, BASS family